MEENPNQPDKFQESAPPESPAPWRRSAPRVSVVLLVLLAACIFFSGVATVLSQLIVRAGAWDDRIMTGVFPTDATEAVRWQIRILLGLQHVSVFTGAGFLVVWLFYRGITRPVPGWPDYLQSRLWPGWRNALLGMLLLLASVPLVLYSFQINKMLPLPESFKMMEDQANEAIKVLLRMDHFGEFLGNLLLIALLPAVGEELVFRGIVQQQLMRRIANPWWALVLSAAIFSFFHFQFEGFLPRLLLGFLLGWLYWQTRNFWVPVIAHFFNNGIQVVGQYATGDSNSVVDLEKDIQVPWFVALLSLFMVLVTMRLIWQQNDSSKWHTD